MASLKSLAKDTAIYGMSSIVGRFLNYLLVPLYTTKMQASTGEYGIITNLYSYTALLLVILTFGMETTFFRYANDKDENPIMVYSTTLLMVGGVCVAFVSFLLAFLPQITSVLQYTDHPDYVAVLFTCVAIDAFQSIPFAYLRYKKRPIKFAVLKLLFILLNVSLNLIYFLLLPLLYTYPTYKPWVSLFYDGRFDVGAVFYINLVCTSLVTFCFYKEFKGVPLSLDRALMKRMWHYSWPILILGLVGILNLTIDKIIFPFISPLSTLEANIELGIYGACAKVAMIMTLFTQAFRYAYEPFIFNQQREKDSRQTYALAMKYFLICSFLAFLGVIGYLDIFKYIVASDYHAGLQITPIVMLSGVLLGVFFNLSLWYKLTDKTIYGLWFSLAGFLVLITINILFIPQYSYKACAWANVAGYATATLLSYIYGQKKYPIPYPLKSIGIYVLLTAFFTIVMYSLPQTMPIYYRLGINTTLILLFIAHVVYHDLPLKPIILFKQKIAKKFK